MPATLRHLVASAALVASTAPLAAAQTLSGPTSGFAFNSGTQTFVDPSFEYAYSLRARGFTPGSTGFQLLGGQGQGSPAGSPCVVGEPCQTTGTGTYGRGAANTYSFTLNFGGAALAPGLTVSGSGATTGSSSIALAPLGGTAGLNAFFLQLSGNAGALTVGNLAYNGMAFGGAVTTTGGATYYRIDTPFTADGGVLTGTITTAGLTGGSQESPRVELYAGRTAAAVVPEPSTYALLGAGLAGLVGVARRRRLS